MLKSLSVGGLLVLTVLTPSIGLARDSSVSVQRAAVRVNPGLHLGQLKKLSTDVQVSLMGKVTAVSGTTLTVLGNNGSSYVVDTASAKFVRRYNGGMTSADVQVNDQVFVQGTLTGTTIKAKFIQDFSLQTQNASFSGTIKSFASGGFMLQTANRGLQTIFVSSATKIVRNGNPISLSDLPVGTSVKVEGVWNNTNNNVMATKIQMVVKQEQVRLNGTVSSVNSGKLMFTGTDGKSYTVTLSGVQLAGRSVVSNDWTKVKVGDTVQVWGKMMTGATEIKASLVIDFSL